MAYPGIDKSRIEWCIETVEANGYGKYMADEAREEVKATFESHRELLDALENLVNELDKHGGPQWRGSPMEQAARAAIAKAKGQ